MPYPHYTEYFNWIKISIFDWFLLGHSFREIIWIRYKISIQGEEFLTLNFNIYMFSPKVAVNIVLALRQRFKINLLFQQMSKKLYTHQF